MSQPDGSDALSSFLARCIVSLNFASDESDYVSCIEDSTLLNFDLVSIVTGGLPAAAGFGIDYACGADPTKPSESCCSAVTAARRCVPATTTGFVLECHALLQDVVLSTYECDALSGYRGTAIFIAVATVGVLLYLFLSSLNVAWRPERPRTGAILTRTDLSWQGKVLEMAKYISKSLWHALLDNVLTLRGLWARQLWALLVKNKVILMQRKRKLVTGQLFVLVLIGVLVGVLRGLTGFTTEEVGFGELRFLFQKPDETRALIYQNLRPFGGLYFLIAYLILISGIIVTLVLEKESRMREALRMTGLGDAPLILSWCVTYFVLYAPLSLALGFATNYGAIFTSVDIALITMFFQFFTLATVAFCHVISVFFNTTRPATIGGIVTVLSVFFLSFDVMSAPRDIQARAALFPPVALALGVNRMLADSSIGTGFALSYSEYSSPNPNLSVDDVIGQMIWSTLMWLLIYWYLDQVIPQQYGTRKPFYFLFTKHYWLTQEFDELKQPKGDRAVSERTSSTATGSDTVATTSFFNDSVDREPPSPEQIELAKSNRCIQIRNLRRVFNVSGLSEGRVAVAGLNLNLYEGQITALLGPNGAGKSTTFGMLTGLISPSSGDAQVYNYSLRQDMDRIRRKMGICPQHDILYTQLTVKQNLELFSVLRNVPKHEILPGIKQLLKDLAIPEKLNYRVSELSGGQKRKVSVASALLGDSKVVYLDEPTAGMDPFSRRCTWDVLRKNRKGRVMVLTTHFMDEADLLGDRIAIIAEGNLCCHGTSLYLKHRFGKGYKLTLARTHHSTEEVHRLKSLVRSVIPEAAVNTVTESEISFQLPLAKLPQFPSLLRRLEGKVSEKNIGISAATLEEVFLNVADKFSSDGSANRPPVARVVDSKKQTSRRRVGSFCTILRAMLIKRWNVSKRDFRTFAFLIALPIVFIIVPLLVPEIPIMSLVFPGRNKENPQPANPDCVDILNNVDLGGFAQSLDTSDIQCCAPDLPAADFKTCMEDDGRPQCIEVDFYESTCFNRMAYCKYVPWLCDYDECCDFKNRKSPFYLCQQDTPLNHFENELNYNNFCPDRSLGEIQAYVNAFIVSVAVLLACIFPPASIMAYAVMETEEGQNTKFQQMVAGVRGPVFWLGNFIWDQFVLMVPILASAIVFPMYGQTFDASSLGGDSVRFVAPLLVLGFVVAILPLAYAWSFSYKEHSKALVAMVVLNMVTGAAFGIISYILIVINFYIEAVDLSSRDIMDDYVRYGLLVFPGFALTDGLLRLQTAVTFNCIRNNNCVINRDGEASVSSGLLGFQSIQLNFIYLAGTTVLAWFILFWRENRGLKFLFCCCRRRRVPASFKEGSRMDHDVRNEKKRLRDQHKTARRRGWLSGGGGRDMESAREMDAVQIFGLTKKYKSGKLALDDLWLGVKPGQCFGYLGVNGAGKTTTMRILTGQEESTHGKALLAGHDVHTQLRKARRHLGFCPQFDALFGTVTVEEHLYLYARIRGVNDVKMEVQQSIEQMQLGRFRKVQARQLSGGNKRKLSAAIALIGSPPIVFLDEPSTGMDPTSMRFMWNVIRGVVQDTRCAVILTTHSLIECESLCNRVGILIDGTLRCLGSLQHIKSKFGHGYTVEVRTRIVDAAAVQDMLPALPSEPITKANVKQLCSLLGNPNRFMRLDGNGGRTEKPFPGLDSGDQVSHEVFARWWLQEDLCDQVYIKLKGRWQSMRLMEKHGPYMLYQIKYGEAKLSSMFEFIEEHKLSMGVTHYSISQTGLEQIFNSFAKDQEAVSGKSAKKKADKRRKQTRQTSEGEGVDQSRAVVLSGSQRQLVASGRKKTRAHSRLTAGSNTRSHSDADDSSRSLTSHRTVGSRPTNSLMLMGSSLLGNLKNEKEVLEEEYDAIMDASDDGSESSEWVCDTCTYSGTPGTELNCSLCGALRPNVERYVT